MHYMDLAPIKMLTTIETDKRIWKLFIQNFLFSSIFFEINYIILAIIFRILFSSVNR